MTAGTLFASTKLPLTMWFLAIYLLSQAKIGLSAPALKRQIGVSYPSAWLMHHKVTKAMADREAAHRLCGAIEYRVEPDAGRPRQAAGPGGLSISVRLLCGAHRLSLEGAHGAGQQPGELNRWQNWIGGTPPGNARLRAAAARPGTGPADRQSAQYRSGRNTDTALKYTTTL